MEWLNYLAKFGSDNNLEFVTNRLEFNPNKPYGEIVGSLDYHTEPYPSGVFNPQEVEILLAISKDYFRHLARNPKDATLLKLGKILHSIMSQDIDTKEQAFEIQEFTDYFTDFIKNEEERIKFAEDIVAKWQ